jgi:nitroreductase/Pyruvate/2-oxoacid:ferredoxin oxidoreductase delta subunit
MSLICVDKENCNRDGLCAQACPPGIIRMGEDGFPEVEKGAEDFCISCGHCVSVCMRGAMSHERLPMENFLPARRVKPEAAGEVAELMRGRRSVREFKDTPVDRHVLQELLDTARFAPTATNSQKVGWIMVEDPAATRRLAELGADWLRKANIFPRYVALLDRGRDMILRGAPHLVLAHAPADYAWGAIDCTIAATYLELAAAAHGLGACWAGLMIRAVAQHPPAAQALGLPEGRTVHAALMLGLPKYRYYLVPPRNKADVSWL